MPHSVRPRRLHRPIGVNAQVQAPASAVVDFVSDLSTHAQLAPRSVRVLALHPSARGGAYATVRLRGPLGIRRTAATELLPSEENLIAGQARIGRRTTASVVWTISANPAGSEVSLCATVDSAGAIDRLVLLLGGRRWLRREFAAALERLAPELNNVYATSALRSPAGHLDAALPTTAPEAA